jgi:CubicO group peptidase (beta-lactamase class C family)
MSATELSGEPFATRVDAAIEACQFSGVVRVDQGGRVVFERAAGLADRRWSIPMTTATRLSMASGTKGFTALAVMALVESGELRLDTPARSLLGADLPLIDDGVTVEHLLAHRSGIGDYLDESTLGDIETYAMPVPVHQLDSTEGYVTSLDGYPQVSPPGEEFAYNNGGYVVLALLAERAAKMPFEQLVDELVVKRAGLANTEFLRSDSLARGVATGYLDLEGLRTNSLHLPVLGSGDGGLFTTAADMATFWTALFDGRIVSEDKVRLMTAPRSESPKHKRRNGMGFWLTMNGPTVFLEGYDAGVSFRSMHDPTTSTTRTTISNTSEGTWNLLRSVAELHET